MPVEVPAVALAAARAAAWKVLEGYGRSQAVREKTSHTDLVSATDLAAEEAARSVIDQAFPDHAILGEEEGMRGSGEHAWYIDPLDGTTNFVHGVPLFAVSVAYARAGTVLAGVVMDPLREETFRAVRGEGAFLNDRPLMVDDRGTLREALLATGFQYDSQQGGRLNLQCFTHLMQRARNVRALGSAALGLCYVAAGRLSGFWELRLGPWDTAAGALVVEEAGGRVTHLDGSPFHPHRPDIAASNSLLHETLLAEISLGNAHKQNQTRKRDVDM